MDQPNEIIVVGAGAVGLTAALGLAKGGRSVTLVGRPGPARPGRTVALLQGSADLLRRLDVWPSLAKDAEALRTMRVVDATGSLFAPPPVSFRANEIGLSAFGYNVDNSRLERALYDSASATPGLRILTDKAVGASFNNDDAEVLTESGEAVRGALVIAADGRDSVMRKVARIGVRTTHHPQRAMTAIFDHALPHENVSTEFHTRQGPFTLVPLPDAARHRSSLVWVMTPSEAERRRRLDAAAFAREAEAQCERLLGVMTLTGSIGTFPIVTRSAFRLTGDRLALVGEAAHALPPIGAQGLNLSFRDVSALLDCLGGQSLTGVRGCATALTRYEQARRGDVASRIIGVDLLNQSLLSHAPGMDFLRGLGLATLGRVAPLRRMVMRHGLAPGA